jgi:hypothetical protein
MAGLRSRRPTGVIARAIRLMLGAALTAPVLVVAASAEASPLMRVAVLATLAAAVWRADVGLVILAGLTPAGLLLAPTPARAAEALVWAFLAGWLLGVQRPLAREWPRRLIAPASAYVLCAAGSWLALTLQESRSVDLARLPLAIGRSLLRDHLLYSSAEPETWTLLLTAAGVAALIAGASIVRDRPRVAVRVGAALVVSMAAMSLLSATSAAYLWSTNEHAAWFLQRRSAFHLGDVNAAGSQYVLAGLTALGLAMFDRPRWRLWTLLLVLMIPGAWFAGSRTAALAGVATGLLVILQGREHHWRPTRAQVSGLATTAAIVLLAGGGAILARGTSDSDAAGRALRMRVQFAETSARMTASAPLHGVGIGRYHSRSHEFMPAELQAVYPYENAHNYFAQQFAELGLIGGVAFVWLIAAALSAAAGTLRSADRLGVGLFAGAAGYLVTCLAGHPLLVPEAALPFAIAFGAAAGAGLSSNHGRRTHRATAAAFAIGVIALTPVVTAAVSREPKDPIERGFYEVEQEPDGTPYRWTMPHAVTYVQSAPGFLRLTVYAPDGDVRPYVLDVEADGAPLSRLVLDDDRWQTFEVPIRPRRKAEAPTRRIDLRIDRIRTRTLGSGLVEPLGVMVREIRWIPAR